MNRKMITLCSFFLALTVSATEFVLFKDGKPTVVLENAAFASADNGLNKEQKIFNRNIAAFAEKAGKCTGTALPVVDKAKPGQNRIIFNYAEKEQDRLDEFSWDFPDPKTMRITATPNSIKFALNGILEKYFGVMFLMSYPGWMKRPDGYDPDMETVYPAKKDVSVKMENFSDGAFFNCKRRIYMGYPDWRLRSAYPGGHGMAVFAFPAAKYAADNSWPKQILPVINGKRFVMPKLKPVDPKKANNGFYKHIERYVQYFGFWQPCWSNPESVTIAAANILEMMEKTPVDPLYGGKRYYVDLGINDNGGCCECAKCLKAVGRKRGRTGGADYSDLYWKWVNSVAEIVCRKYPKLKFNCLAYREVVNPPSFKLHPNVIPKLCRELAGPAVSPEEKEKTEKLFHDWTERAETIFLWDYAYGSRCYIFPRIYFDLQAEMLKMAYKNKVRGIYCEAQDQIGMDGPKFYLMDKLLWNVNVDINVLLKEWCRGAVGPEAAPYLEQYYRFWEQYWKRPEIQKTKWFYSASNIYMTLGESGSYTYAMRKGEMAKLRKLLETVIAKTRTPMEKKRAEYFMRLFKISENASKCLYSEYIQPDGYVADAADAASLLRAVPDAVKALDELQKESLVTLPVLNSVIPRVVRAGVCNFSAITRFLKDPAVKAELEKIAGNPELPITVRSQARIMSGVKFQNRMNNGSFEDTSDQSWNFVRRGKLDGTHVTDGKWAVCGVNPAIRMTQKTGLVHGKKYMLMVDVYVEKESAEGEAYLLTNPQTADGRNTQYNLTSKIKLNKGWQTLSNTIELVGKRESMQAEWFFLQFWCEKFEKDEPVWIDNVRLYQLD